MQVAILAGGLGTRLAPVAAGRPKSLVAVAGRPFIERQIELLESNDMCRVLICAGYGGKELQAHLGDGSGHGVHIDYSFEGPDRLLGTAGALIHALPKLDEAFLVLYGDSYLPTDYRAVADKFMKRRPRAMMCVFRNRGKWDKSNVRVAGDRVVYYSKDAQPGEADYIDYGLTAYRRNVIEAYVDTTPPLDLSAVLSDLVERGELLAHEVQERFYEIGKPEGLAELETYLRRRVQANGVD